MKLLTTNFVQCAVQLCNALAEAFPLLYSETELAQEPQDFKPQFVAGILDRLDWNALLQVAAELGNTLLPPTKPEIDVEEAELPAAQQLLQDLHLLLLETQIVEGKMTCRNCGHIYHIKNSIPNFLLPPHLA